MRSRVAKEPDPEAAAPPVHSLKLFQVLSLSLSLFALSLVQSFLLCCALLCSVLCFAVSLSWALSFLYSVQRLSVSHSQSPCFCLSLVLAVLCSLCCGVSLSHCLKHSLSVFLPVSFLLSCFGWCAFSLSFLLPLLLLSSSHSLLWSGACCLSLSFTLPALFLVSTANVSPLHCLQTVCCAVCSQSCVCTLSCLVSPLVSLSFLTLSVFLPCCACSFALLLFCASVSLGCPCCLSLSYLVSRSSSLLSRALFCTVCLSLTLSGSHFCSSSLASVLLCFVLSVFCTVTFVVSLKLSQGVSLWPDSCAHSLLLCLSLSLFPLSCSVSLSCCFSLFPVFLHFLSCLL